MEGLDQARSPKVPGVRLCDWAKSCAAYMMGRTVFGTGASRRLFSERQVRLGT